MKERLVTLEDISLFLSGSSISEIKLALCLTMMIQRNVYLLAPVSVKWLYLWLKDILAYIFQKAFCMILWIHQVLEMFKTRYLWIFNPAYWPLGYHFVNMEKDPLSHKISKCKFITSTLQSLNWLTPKMLNIWGKDFLQVLLTLLIHPVLPLCKGM